MHPVAETNGDGVVPVAECALHRPGVREELSVKTEGVPVGPLSWDDDEEMIPGDSTELADPAIEASCMSNPVPTALAAMWSVTP